MNLRRNLSKYISLYNYVEAYRTNRLPSGYTRLSYIQGDGTAYLDLNTKLTSNDSIDISLEYTTSTSAKTIFGYRDSASQNNIMIFFATTADDLVLDFNNSSYSEYRLRKSISPNTMYDIVLSAKERSIYSNGTIVGTNTTVNSDNIVTDKVYLFYGNRALAPNSKFDGRIYKFKISDRMDLIPAKDSNDVVGMYDLKSGKFFTNANTEGAFTAGDVVTEGIGGEIELKDAIRGKLNELTVYGKTKNKSVDGLDSLIANGGTELIPETYLDTVIAKGKCVQENRLTNGLPSEYQELYYIESTGTQYINTGIKPNYLTGIELNFTPTNDNEVAFGCRWSGSPEYDTFGNVLSGVSHNLTTYFGRYSNQLYNNDTNKKYYKDTNVSIEFFGNKLDVNAYSYTVERQNIGFDNNPNEIYLFALNNIGTPSTLGSARLFYVRYYDNGGIIFNGIPARRKSDSEVGMYDTVSKTFLTNSGTGTFIASEDKLVDDTASKYTKVNGVTNIDSTLFNTGIYADVDDMEFIVKVTPSLNSFYILQARGGSTGSNINGISGSVSGSTIIGAIGAALPNGVISSIGSRDITHTYIIDWKHKDGVATLTVNDLTAGTSFVDSATYNTSDFVPSGNPICVYGNLNGDRVTIGNTLYYAKVYKQGKLVVDYIPATTTVNDVTIPGFFDRVTGTFKKPEDCGYSNDTLTPGSALTTEIPDPYNPVDIWCNNGKIDKSGDVIVALPSGYTQLEYLESSGTQYIDTGIKGNRNTKVHIKARYYATTTAGGSGRIFGSRVAAAVDAFAIGSASGTASTNSAVSFFFGNQNYLVTDKPIILDEWLDIVFDKTTHSINGVNYGEPYNNETFETPLNLKLFGFDNYGTIGVGYVDVAYCQLWDNNVLIRNLVPAKNSSGTVGMYDTVSGTFFTNQGTDEFIAGPTVNNRNVQEVVTAPNGKNLFDKNNIQRIYGYFSATNAQWAWATNGNCVKIPCKPNTKYTARYDGTSSIVVLGFGSTYTDDEPSENNVFVPVTNSIRTPNPTKDTPVTITTGANDKWLIIAWPADELYPAQYEEMRQHLIIEEGETPTEYEVGKGFNTAKCENLLSVGTYQDTQSMLDGTVTRNVGVLVLDGTENWNLAGSGNALRVDIRTDIGLPPTQDLTSPMICTHYPFDAYFSGGGATQPGTFNAWSGPEGYFLRFSIVGMDITTVDQWKSWLVAQSVAGTPVIIVYPLATSVTETTSNAILNKKEVSVISGSLSISDLEVTSTESEHTIPTPSQPLSLRCNNGTIVTKFHNDDYTRLEYIESTDRLPAINTSARYSAGNDFIVEWSAVDTESQTTGTTLFAAISASPYSGGLYGRNTSRSYYIGSTGTGQSGLVGYVSDDGLVHNWKIVVKDIKMDLYKDGTRVGGIDNISGTIDTEHDIYIFCGGWVSALDQTLTQFSRWRLYSWKLTVAGTVVRDLVPAKRNKDNELGMYDKVTDTFFINCATGSFVGGNITTDVKGTQETIITVKETNLFDNDTTPIINAYVNANNGTLTAGTPGSSTQYSFVIPCKSNTTYKLDGMTALSGWGSFTDSTIGTVATAFTKGNNTLTTGPNDQYLIGMVYATGTSYDYRNTLDIREMDIMAYVENLLASGTYADTQDILTGLVTHNIGIKVLDGTENWNYYSVTQGVLFRIQIADSVSNAKDALGVLCNAYQVVPGGSRGNGTLTGSATNYDFINDNYTTLDTWKAYLAEQYAKGTPVIIIYPLATPTVKSVAKQILRNSPAYIKDASMEGLILTQTHSIHTAPTPAFPLDLVCNNGVIKGISKNLFDPAENNIVCGYWIRNSDGKPEASAANFYTDMYMPVKPNTSYVAFGKKKSDNTLSNYNRIAWYDSSKTWIRNSTYTQGTIGTDTSPSNAAYARFHCNIDGNTLTTDYVLEWNWMLYEGTEEESFVPYGVIAEGNPEKLNIKGKNLFDVSNVQILPNKAIDDTGTYVNNSNVNICDTYIYVKPNTTYTISGNTLSNTGSTGATIYFRLAYYDSNKTFISRSERIEGKYYTFTTDSNTNYIKFHYANSIADLNTYVLEEGIRPTKYEEYMNVDYLVPTLLSMDNYIDTQELQSGVKNTRVGVKVLDGTEEWTSGSVTTAYTSPCWDTPLQTEPDRIEIYSTHFEGTDVTNANMPNNTIKLTNSSLFSGNACMVIKGNDYPTAADFKAYLASQYAAGTPVIIVYPLADTITEIEGSANITVDSGTNTITRISDSGVGDLEMEVKYKKLK